MDNDQRDRREWPEPDGRTDEPDTTQQPSDEPAAPADEAPAPEWSSGGATAPAEVESWPSQDAAAESAATQRAPSDEPPWPTQPPAAESAPADAWPTSAPERVEAPDSTQTNETAPPPPGEVEAYSSAPRGADSDATPAADDAGPAFDPQAAAAAAAATGAGPDVPESEEAATGESTQCPRCGTENRPGLAFCRNCGQRLVAAGVATTVERPAAPEGSTACPRCGTHNRAGVAFCQNCGANLRGTAPDYVPPAVADERGAERVATERRGAILGPIVLLIGAIGLVTAYLLPFAYGGNTSLFDRGYGSDGYGAAFWAGYPEVNAALADQAYFGLAAPSPILVVLLVVLAIAGFVRAAPGPLQTIGLAIALLWSVALIVLFLILEVAGNWTGDLVGMLRVLTPAGIIFFLASLIVLIGTLTRFGRS